MSKFTQLEIVQKIQSLAVELGRTPTLIEFTKYSGMGDSTIYRMFGGWVVAVKAAGLDPVQKQKTQKIDNSIFEKDIEQHLEDYKPRTFNEIITPWPRIAVLGDIHEPFSHEKTKSEFVLFCEKEQPEWIVQVGDAFDQYSWAKFPRSHNIFTPKEEETVAKKNLEELFNILRLKCPNSKLVLLHGNHSIRALKRVLESVPTMEHWAQKYLEELMTFDGVKTIHDPREEFLIGDIAFHHGYLTQLGAHRDYMMMNAVVGHTHMGGAVFRQIQGKILWELNAGLAGDPFAKGLSYTSQKMSRWTLGWAWVDNYGPRFCPLR
jgi:predicted phosphodiesterase